MRIGGLLCLLIAIVAQGQQIKYNTLARPLIEQRLSSFKTVNSERGEALRAMFEEAGCSGDKLTEQIVRKKQPPNVICSLPGEIDSTIVVGAHFDFVKIGQGVVDNWSGASLLPSLFQSLNLVPRRHNYVFIGFTDEESGLLGSDYYLRKLTKPDMRKIAAMVNMDSLGTGITRVETVRSSKALIDALGDVAVSVKIRVDIVNVHKVGRSDSDSFQDRNVPTINFHSLTQETYPLLHTARDRMDAIRMDEYYDSYRLIAAYLAYLDQVLKVE